MKTKLNELSEIRECFNGYFMTGLPCFRSLHDLIWQIAINGMLTYEKEPFLFHVDVLGEHGTELIIALSSGGYKKTGLYFVSGDYSECCDIAENLNYDFFEIEKKEQMRLISKSMFSNA